MNVAVDSLVCALLVAFLTSAVLGVALLRAVAFLPHAQPNARSLHARPVPRVAALMLWGGWLAGAGWIWASGESGEVASAETTTAAMVSALFFGGWAAVTAVSLWDDWRGASARLRLLVQTAAALAAALGLWALTPPEVVYFQGVAGLGWAALWVLSTVWMCNLFNFMDGSDGLAATMALAGLAVYAGVGYAHEVNWWWLPLLGAAALVPLLAVNLPPARMFIGDVGAVPMGFVSAVFGGWGVVEGAWGIWFPLLVFLPFILDATVTLLRRLWRREKVWEGHKTHYYQRLLQMGAGHRGTLAIYAMLMVGCAGTAWYCTVKTSGGGDNTGEMALLGWTLVHLGFFAAIDYHWRKRKHS